MPADEDWYEDVFNNDTDTSWFSLMDSPDHLVAGSATIVLPMATAGENVVLTHSGWGDGVFPVLCTVDARGRHRRGGAGYVSGCPRQDSNLRHTV